VIRKQEQDVGEARPASQAKIFPGGNANILDVFQAQVLGAEWCRYLAHWQIVMELDG
jgi:hypothetical protein